MYKRLDYVANIPQMNPLCLMPARSPEQMMKLLQPVVLEFVPSTLKKYKKKINLEDKDNAMHLQKFKAKEETKKSTSNSSIGVVLVSKICSGHLGLRASVFLHTILA